MSVDRIHGDSLELGGPGPWEGGSNTICIILRIRGVCRDPQQGFARAPQRCLPSDHFKHFDLSISDN